MTMDYTRETTTALFYLGGHAVSLCADCGRPHHADGLRCEDCQDAADKAAIPLRHEEDPMSRTFRDTGCNLAPSCLRCPFEVCKYDRPAARAKGAAA